MMEQFTITKEHLKLLKEMYVKWEHSMAGAPCIDCKRPYGNSDMEGDIAEILGIELFEDAFGEKHMSSKQLSYIKKIHTETETALQICLCTASFTEGTYKMKDKYDDRSWVKIK